MTQEVNRKDGNVKFANRTYRKIMIQLQIFKTTFVTLLNWTFANSLAPSKSCCLRTIDPDDEKQLATRITEMYKNINVVNKNSNTFPGKIHQ